MGYVTWDCLHGTFMLDSLIGWSHGMVKWHGLHGTVHMRLSHGMSHIELQNGIVTLDGSHGTAKWDCHMG